MTTISYKIEEVRSKKKIQEASIWDDAVVYSSVDDVAMRRV